MALWPEATGSATQNFLGLPLEATGIHAKFVVLFSEECVDFNGY